MNIVFFSYLDKNNYHKTLPVSKHLNFFPIFLDRCFFIKKEISFFALILWSSFFFYFVLNVLRCSPLVWCRSLDLHGLMDDMIWICLLGYFCTGIDIDMVIHAVCPLVHKDGNFNISILFPNTSHRFTHIHLEEMLVVVYGERRKGGR